LYDIDYVVFNLTGGVELSLYQLLKSVFKSIYKNSGDLVKNIHFIRNIKNIFRVIKAGIIADQIKSIEPKLVITVIDNSTLFHLVSKICDDILFLAVQNGTRSIWCATNMLDKNIKYNIDEYFCFGPQVQDMFSKYQHNIKKYHNCGSLLGGHFLTSKLNESASNKKKYDICLISQWSKDLIDFDKLPKNYMRLNEAITILTEYLALYALENNKRVCIALRSDDPSELEYYERLFNGNCVYQRRDETEFSSYIAAVNSNLIISLHSTLALESFGMGLKVLFVNTIGEDWLRATTDMGIWYLSKPDYQLFCSRVEQLLDMSQDEYLVSAKKEMKYVMLFDHNRPAHVVIRDRVLDIIGTTKE
jgi:surface carbohydrate biosynthesis protein